MDYKPLKDVLVGYFRDSYNHLMDISQKVMDTLSPSSGLENRLAFAGIPNSILSRQTDNPDKLQGYLFAEYGVRDYRRNGRHIVVTRSDGKQIPLDVPRNVNGVDDQYVKNALRNHGIEVNNKVAGKIAKMLRQKS